VNTIFTTTLLWVFAVLLLAIGVAQLVLLDSTAGGASSIAIGASLIAIAASTKKKSDG